MTTPQAWVIGPIMVSTMEGTVQIPGWSNGTFGIDWRGVGYGGEPPAYVVSHLATGWGLCAVVSNLEPLQEWVDIVSRRLDWSVKTTEAMRRLILDNLPALREAFDEIGHVDPKAYLFPAGDHSPMPEGMTTHG